MSQRLNIAGEGLVNVVIVCQRCNYHFVIVIVIVISIIIIIVIAIVIVIVL